MLQFFRDGPGTNPGTVVQYCFMKNLPVKLVTFCNSLHKTVRTVDQARHFCSNHVNIVRLLVLIYRAAKERPGPRPDSRS